MPMTAVTPTDRPRRAAPHAGRRAVFALIAAAAIAPLGFLLADREAAPGRLIPAARDARSTRELRGLPDGDGFSVVVLSDTQDYADRSVQYAKKTWKRDCTQYFRIQTEWIKRSAAALRTRFVFHTGDITQMDRPEEWKIARDALSVLDGVLPCALCVGNHDMGCVLGGSPWGKTAVRRDSRFDEFFPASRVRDKPWFGAAKDGSLANAWYRLDAGGLRLMVLCLEFKPREATLAWADSVVTSHPERRVIVLTHGYMRPHGSDNALTALPYAVEGNDGPALWRRFISRHANIFLVLCGHTQGEGMRVDKGAHGNDVYQVLADYRHLEYGGESWLRYMVFRPQARRIEVYTYNPALDEYRDGPSSRFSIPLP